MGNDYTSSMACRLCYAKHLGKAVVEAEEYLDDTTRWQELSRAIGDIGCAEDHASALGRPADRQSLRDVRSGLLSGDQSSVDKLRSMAEAAARDAVAAVREEAQSRVDRVREAVAARKAAEASAQGGQAV